MPFTDFAMDNSDCYNLKANEDSQLSGDVDFNDLLRALHKDPNNEAKSLTCTPYTEIESLTPVLSKYKTIFFCRQPEYSKYQQ